MKLVMRFASPGKNDTVTIRQQTINLRTNTTQHFNWYEAVAAAIFHAQPGERIVALIEEGHQ